jgi:hypothetical protein
MKVEYSRQAMQALLSLEAGPRRRAVQIIEQIAAGDTTPEEPPGEEGAGDGADKSPQPQLLSLVEGSEFQLAPYSATGDLVLARKDGRITVIALTDVLGGLNEASEQ